MVSPLNTLADYATCDVILVFETVYDFLGIPSAFSIVENLSAQIRNDWHFATDARSEIDMVYRRLRFSIPFEGSVFNFRS